jgi:hypothetical protein
MKRYGWFAAFLLVVAVPAWAQKLPEQITYTIYVQGQKYGQSDIRVSYTDGGEIVLESTTKLSRESIEVELNSRTIADAGTFVVKSYLMTGHHAGKPYQADVVIDGRLIKINQRNPEEYLHDTREARAEPVLVLEDFVIEHHLLMAKAHMTLGEESWGYDIIYPGSSILSTMSVTRASTSVVESNIKETVCTKLVFLAEQSQPYAIYYDPGRGLPVYMAFPAVETEIFLGEFYGDEPVIRWRQTAP